MSLTRTCSKALRLNLALQLYASPFKSPFRPYIMHTATAGVRLMVSSTDNQPMSNNQQPASRAAEVSVIHPLKKADSWIVGSVTFVLCLRPYFIA
jgi:hypothetical protein